MSVLTGRAARDANRVPVNFGVSSVDGVTVLPIEVNPSTGRLLVDSVGGGTSAVNLTQVGGAAIALGQTTKSASLPVTLASDQGALAVNMTQINGVVGSVGNGTTDTGTQRVTIASDSTGHIEIWDATNTANILAGDAGFNSVVTSSGTRTMTFTTSSAGVQTLLANTNVEGYSWIEVVYTSVGSGLALTGQFSTASGGTYVNSSTFLSSGSTVGALGTTVNTIYYSAIHGNFFQLAVSALTSGTFAGTVTLRAVAPPYESLRASQVGTWTVQPGNTANTTPWLVDIHATAAALADTTTNPTTSLVGALGEVFNGTSWDRTRTVAVGDGAAATGIVASGLMAISPSDSLFYRLRADNPGDAIANNAISVFTVARSSLYNGSTWDRARSMGGISAGSSTGLTATGVAGGLMPNGTALNTYSVHITTNTTTTPTASTAYISNIVISVPTAGTTSTITIKDKQGTPLTLISSFSTAAALANGDATYNYQVPVKMVSGIDIVTAGGVAATVDVWIGYYQ